MSALANSAQSAPTKTGGIEDGELVRRIRRGDEQAFELLYQRYNRRITAYIHGMVHDHARAEDVSQDVFVSALRRIRETDRPIAFKPWIYEIAKNACIDQFRRSKRAEEVSYDADEGLGAADYGRLVSADAMPEAQLESKTQLDHLRGAFGGLSETHHEILVMRELEGLSYREIGERLGMSRPSVESTLFRARRRLTEEYEELVSGARCQRIQAIIAEAAASEPGARDQRRLARHISHCQPCRRQARLAGLDIPVTADRPVRARIAAFLPLPLFLKKRWLGLDSGADPSAAAGAHLSSVAQWSAQFGSVVDPSWLKAAAAAATVVVAGAGAGFAGQSTTPTAPAGSLGQIVTGLETDSADKQAAPVTAGTSTGPAIAAALRTANALAGALPAASATSGSTAKATSTNASTGTTPAAASGGGSAGSSASAQQPSVPDPASAVDNAAAQVADSVPSDAGASTGGGNPGTGPADTSAPSADNLPDVDTSVPASNGVSAPDTSGATDTAAGAAETAGGAVGGATDADKSGTVDAGSLVGGG